MFTETWLQVVLIVLAARRLRRHPHRRGGGGEAPDRAAHRRRRAGNLTRVELERRVTTLGQLLVRIAAVVIVVVAALMVLGVFNVDIGPAIAGLGIAGLAVGFGAQALIKDWLSGIFIVAENQYNAGEHVRIAGVEGVVEDFSLRRTMLRDADGTVHHVPNGQIIVASNLSRGRHTAPAGRASARARAPRSRPRTPRIRRGRRPSRPRPTPLRARRRVRPRAPWHATARLGLIRLGDQHRRLAVLDRLGGDDDLLDVGALRDVVHHVEQRLLDDRAQGARAGLAVDGQLGGGVERIGREDQLDLVEREELR